MSQVSQASQVTREGRHQLHTQLDAVFDNEELKTLCFNLGIDWDNLPGGTKQAKVRELILRCERTHNISALHMECKRQRPNHDWTSSFLVKDKRGSSDEPTQRGRRLVWALGLVAIGLVVIFAITQIPTLQLSRILLSSPPPPQPTARAQAAASSLTGDPVTADCPFKWFFAADAQQARGLCPIGEPSARAFNQQDFQHGKMMSFTGNSSIWVVIGPSDRAWEWIPYEDTWAPGQPEPTPAPPPSGLHVPTGRFGKVWYQQKLVNTLGWATGEVYFYSGAMQYGDQGVWFFQGKNGVIHRCSGSGDGGICEVYDLVTR